MTSTSALILAAGTASRMGRTKQLLDLGGSPLLERVMQNVMTFPFTEIITVIGHQAEQVQNNIVITDKRCRWVVNADYAKGQSHSLKIGMTAIRTAHVTVFLGDQPFITNATILAIYEEGERWGRELQRPFVVRPAYRSVPGHPVFFGNAKQTDFSELSGDRGAKSLINRMDNHYDLPVEDDGILFDIDTPEAYERAKQRWDVQNI